MLAITTTRVARSRVDNSCSTADAYKNETCLVLFLFNKRGQLHKDLADSYPSPSEVF